MWHLMRPGNIVRFWSPRYTHKPDVEPPAMLRFAAALAVLSIVGTLLYAVAQTLMSSPGSLPEASAAIYVAVVHFVLPLGVVYTVSSNLPSSRWLIALYTVSVCAAATAGYGVAGITPAGPAATAGIATLIVAVVLLWLFSSPRMRFYYARLSDRPLPAELAARAAELGDKSGLSPRMRAALVWCLDQLELLVMIGLIVAVVYAWMSIGA